MKPTKSASAQKSSRPSRAHFGRIAAAQTRADAVRKALSLLGVPEAQLESVSFGKEKPAALGSSEADMEKNRRAEISYR